MRATHLRRKEPPGLMLTSLLDMFTIILIFLIVSFEAEDYEFKLNPDLSLPESTANSVFKPAVNLAITPAALMQGEQVIARLKNGRFPAEDYAQGEVPELRTFLETHYGEQLARLAAQEEGEEETTEEGEEESGDIILLQADQNLDYDTLYLVLRTARQVGFGKYRLAIMKK